MFLPLNGIILIYFLFKIYKESFTWTSFYPEQLRWSSNHVRGRFSIRINLYLFNRVLILISPPSHNLHFLPHLSFIHITYIIHVMQSFAFISFESFIGCKMLRKKYINLSYWNNHSYLTVVLKLPVRFLTNSAC